jgi:hypothetical protein
MSGDELGDGSPSLSGGGGGEGLGRMIVKISPIDSKTRDNAKVSIGRRGFLTAVLAVAGSAGCGGRGLRPAALGPSPELRTAATLSVSPAATTAPLSPEVPPLSVAARAAGFVDVRTVAPDAIVDLPYATPNNFTGAPL